MEFRLLKSSDWGFEGTVVVETLDDLLRLIEENGNVVVSLKGKPTIEIYDNYRE